MINNTQQYIKYQNTQKNQKKKICLKINLKKNGLR